VGAITAATGHFPATIKALACDVFGTVVDWRGSIIAEGEALGRARSLAIDWARFADAWRAGYEPAMALVRSGSLTWTNLDGLHRTILDRLLVEFGLGGLDEQDKEHLNRVWHRLRPWPDSIAGLTRLRTRYVVATLSNGHVALLVNLTRSAGLTWDCILSAELCRHYKPDREVYQMAAQLLGLAPREVLMVAAHPNDLVAAHGAGLATAYVRRPLEFGPNRAAERDPAAVDIIAADLVDLAAQLGA